MTNTDKIASNTTKSALREGRCRQLLARDDSALIVVDVQEKFAPHLQNFHLLIEHWQRLVQGAKLLQVPVLVTEQNPDKLGLTVAPLREWVPEPKRKMRFSAAQCLSDDNVMSVDTRRQVVLCGIETHVCILQTALDLLSWGWDVYVVADAVQSRYELDHSTALQRMESSGVTLVTTESVLFEWCETAEAAEFRDISRLAKSRTS